LRADAFPDVTPDLVTAGLTPPKQQVEVHLADGGHHVVNVGNEASPGRVYVSTGESQTVFLLSQGRVAGLVPKLETVKE
jgi:hypothetical protein